MAGLKGISGARLGWLGGVLAMLLVVSGCGEESGEEVASGGCGLDACTIGEQACVSDVVVRCEAGLDGCGHVVVSACGTGESCEAGACVAGDGCPATACTPGEPSCSDEMTVQVCAAGPDGCGVATAVSCGDGTRCEAGACVVECVDVDGDGWGVGCLLGEDCDDGDASVNPVAQEICNGGDDNCDGSVDEGYPGLGDACSVGTGACQREGVFACNASGNGVACAAAPVEGAPEELCGNSLDDDCDGSVDEGFEQLGEGCEVGLGVCAGAGLLVCDAEGSGLRCDAEASGSGSPELCDGVDNDCDGTADEGITGLGEVCRQGIGRCERAGMRVCDASGNVVCNASETEPLAMDLCGNDEDDDCDGTVDEGNPDLGQVCEVGVGACRNVGVRVCNADASGTQCSAAPFPASANELCGNSLDDDCDGNVDEGFEGFGQGCGVGQGACGVAGVSVCTADRLGLTCSAQEGVEGPERCDNIDNNCDGNIDEAFPQLGAPCTAGMGICARQGQQVCAIDGTRTVCNIAAGTPAPEELCGNNTDDDCDGNVDEGFAMRGNPCTSGLGICARQGQLVCASNGTRLQCNAQPGPDLAEVCDGVDNDCDGMTDEENICGAPCVADLQEPNDQPTQATAMMPQEVIEGTICFFDADFYTLGELVANVPVTINVLFDGAVGNLDVEVYADGEPVAFGLATGENEQVFLVTPREATYTFVVFNPEQDRAMDYRVSALIGGDCADDVFEVNANASEAPQLASGEELSAVMCGSDGTDWFDLGMLQEGAQATLTSRFLHANGNLDVFLWREGQLTPTAMARSVTNDETLSYYNDGAASRFFAEVRLTGSAVRTPYTLSYARVDAFCVDDAYDAVGLGDTIGNPIMLGNGGTLPDSVVAQVDFLRLCEGDVDIYNLGTVQAGQRRQVNVIYDDDQAVLTVEILNSSGQVIAVDEGNGGYLKVPFAPTAGGTYYARVATLGGFANYRISHTEGFQMSCPSDVFEEDGFLNYAPKVQPGIIQSRRACLKPDGPDADTDLDLDFDIIDLGELEAGQELTAVALFQHSQGDIDMFLQYESDIVVQASSGDDNEVIAQTITEPGHYYIFTLLFSDGAGQTDGNPYRLLVNID